MIKTIQKNLIQLLRYHPPRRIKLIVALAIGLIACSLIDLPMNTVTGEANNSYKTSWIGNSFGGGSKWVQNNIDAMYVAPDGTVYTNSRWDEASREAGVYKNGSPIGMLSETHGWGRSGGVAIAANDQYVFMGMTQGNEGGGLTGKDFPPKGSDWYAVRRYSKTNYKPAPFPEGRGYDKSMLIMGTSGPITGLAATNKELYVSDRPTNRIRVYDTKTMKQVRSWSVSRPGKLAIDKKGNLWAIQATGSSGAKIVQYSKAGKPLGATITGVADPTAIAFDRQGRLLVTENGPRQQVLIYNVATKPKQVGTFGSKGGLYAGSRGQIADLKLYGLTGVGTDTAGNLYVGSNGWGRREDFAGTDLRKFSPKGAMQWRLLGLPFVDNADVDPATDGKDVFTKHEHFVMDYSKGSGKEWTYRSFTLDRFRYPDDPRLHNQENSAASVIVRRLDGKRFMYMLGMFPANLSIYRFNGEIAVPSGIVSSVHTDWPKNQPANGSWVWRDRNGDGSIQSNEYEQSGSDQKDVWAWEVDSKGDIWQASESGTIRRYRYRGLDAQGNPMYSSKPEETQAPSPFNQVERIKYFPEQDVMYIAGYTDTHPKTSDEWGTVGTEIIRYDNWSKGKKLRSRAVLPYEPKGDPIKVIKAMDIAGDRIFAVDSRTAHVYVYDAKKGSLVKKLTPGAEVASESGWVDIPYAIRAYRRSNGEYLVFVEEDWKAKIIMYRLRA